MTGTTLKGIFGDEAEVLEPLGHIFDEPTRGIDIGAKAEVHQLIREFSDRSGTAIVISSDIHEILNVCDRILVMRAGKMVGDLECNSASKESILRLATGGN